MATKEILQIKKNLPCNRKITKWKRRIKSAKQGWDVIAVWWRIDSNSRCSFVKEEFLREHRRWMKLQSLWMEKCSLCLDGWWHTGPACTGINTARGRTDVDCVYHPDWASSWLTGWLVTVFMTDWCLRRTHEVSCRDDAVVDLFCFDPYLIPLSFDFSLLLFILPQEFRSAQSQLNLKKKREKFTEVSSYSGKYIDIMTRNKPGFSFPFQFLHGVKWKKIDPVHLSVNVDPPLSHHAVILLNRSPSVSAACLFSAELVLRPNFYF